MRTDGRSWIVERRERTRRLIELGGLVQKSGLAELTGDDRSMIFGALLTLVEATRAPGSEPIHQLWRRRGKRAFQAQAQTRKKSAHLAGEDFQR